MTVWMMVTRDKYELPVAIAGSLKELSRITGSSAKSISSGCSRYKHGIYKGVFRKVEIEEDDDD